MAKRRPANQTKEVIVPLAEGRTEFGTDHAEHEEIARLAHRFWIERGCPIGSPEEDWLRAEAEVRAHKTRRARKATAG